MDNFDVPAPQQARGTPILVTADRAEVHFAVATSSERGSFRLTQAKFVFVGLRQVQFADRAVLVGWCTDPTCRDAAHHNAAIFSGRHCQALASEDFTAALSVVCQRAQAVLDGWGGWPELQAMRATAHVSAASSHVRDFEHLRSAAKGVMADASAFSSWGVILHHRSGPGWFCTSCQQSHACQHLATAGLQAEASQHATLDAGVFERKLLKDFDIVAGGPLAILILLALSSGCIPMTHHRQWLQESAD